MDKKRVAVVGASADRSKFSNKAVRAHLDQGWEVFPVNPKGGTIEGLEAFASIGDVPDSIDRVTVYLPPQVGINLLPDIAAARPNDVYINPGAESDELIERARSLGLDPILACSIVALGVSPADYSD